MRSKIAYIREEECIGCTKCIQACPVDAIIGAAKYTHTVLQAECIGCALCITPCPVDCIEMQPTSQHQYDKQKIKTRLQARRQRLNFITTNTPTLDKKAIIAAAIARTKQKNKNKD